MEDTVRNNRVHYCIQRQVKYRLAIPTIELADKYLLCYKMGDTICNNRVQYCIQRQAKCRLAISAIEVQISICYAS